MIQTASSVTDFIYEKVGFKPTKAQLPLLNSRKRFTLVAGGEQAGKSMVASKYLLARRYLEATMLLPACSPPATRVKRLRELSRGS